MRLKRPATSQRHGAREKGLEIIIDVPHPGAGGFPAAILGDVDRLRQVLINLMDNAVKFTAQGEVTVHAHWLPGVGSDRPAMIEFRVTDSGIGIPADRIGSLFEAFSQVDASTTRKFGGTGLGLAICLRLVKLMGARSALKAILAKARPSRSPCPPRRRTSGSPTKSQGAGLLRGSRALIMDNHPTNVRILRRQLELWGMVVASAESGQDALRWLEHAIGAAGGAADAPPGCPTSSLPTCICRKWTV